jgi:lipid-A-disaccharide synthase
LNKIMISCGEPSGDLYAGALAVEIRRREPDAAIFGLGGQRLMAGGGELLADYRGLSVTGLVEAIRVVPRSFSVLNRLVYAAQSEKPQALVVIDFPDFNFRLAAAVRKLGVPIIYYISPQLWAWRRSRMRIIKRIADRMLVIFPFEEALYRAAGVPVEFVGHPLVDLARAQEPKESFRRELGLDASKPVVALLPGSRPNEIERHLPVMRDAV